MKEQKKLLIGLVGPSLSGKSTVSSYLCTKKNFTKITLSDYIKAYAKKKGIANPSKKDLQNLGNRMRLEGGPSILAEFALKTIQKRNSLHAVIDGIRNIGEINYLRQHESFILVGIIADEEIRYDRWSKKYTTPITYASFQKIENRDTHLGGSKTGLRVIECLNQADFIIENNSIIPQLNSQMDAIISKFKKIAGKLNIIILGPPGAGKSTQGKLIANRLRLVWISIGELLREAYKDRVPEGIQWWEEYGSKGLNAPIALKINLLTKKLKSVGTGYVLDDFPRTKEDLLALKKYLKEAKQLIHKVLLITVSENTSYRRIVERWQEDSQQGVARYDDSPYILKVRIKEGYKKELPLILRYFKKKQLLVRIEGDHNKSIFEVGRSILSTIFNS